MKLAMVLVVLLGVGELIRETNSHASASRGAKLYSEKQYGEAVKAFARAHELAPSARNAFNLGTAEIAAGQREQGSARLGDAIKDPALKADAYFNRGNSALAAQANEHAIRDYTEALRANPNHAGAKRNLEIALRRSMEQQQQQPGGGNKQNQQNPAQQQQQQPQPAPGNQRPQPGQLDPQALLRSVQQQEQEELRRMKGRAAEGRVGW